MKGRITHGLFLAAFLLTTPLLAAPAPAPDLTHIRAQFAAKDATIQAQAAEIARLRRQIAGQDASPTALPSPLARPPQIVPAPPPQADFFEMPTAVMALLAGVSADQQAQIQQIRSRFQTEKDVLLKGGPNHINLPEVRARQAQATTDIQAVLTPAQVTALNYSMPMLNLLAANHIPRALLPPLHLTPAQIEQMRSLGLATRAQRLSIQQATQLQEQQWEQEQDQKMKDALTDFQAKVEALLTPAQKDALRRLGPKM